MADEQPETWYRITDGCYATMDEFDSPVGGGRVYVSTHAYPVTRRTPRGVWLDCHGVPRFVLANARKRFACPTREEAMASFRARKQRQVTLLRNQLRRVEQALWLADLGV